MNESVRNDAARLLSVARSSSPDAAMAVDRCQFAVIVGSHAYGNSTASSDVDVRGFFLAAPEYYFGAKTIKCVDGKQGEDWALYEAKHFFGQLMNANPNIIEMLFVPDDCVLLAGPLGVFLRNRRRDFLSRRCLHSFSGYGFAQLKRIENHLRWIENPPVEPDPGDYQVRRYRNRQTGKVIPVADYEQKLERARRLNAESDSFMRVEDWESVMLLDKEPYGKACREWANYKEWAENRNQLRAELERQYGYDTKHASHLVRLFLQCQHILRDRDLPVRLPDEDLAIVRDVRAGKMSYDELLRYAAELDAQMKALSDSSGLPASPDINELSRSFAEAALEALSQGD